MSETIEDLFGKGGPLEGVNIKFGLRAQGHLPTIEKMLNEGASWRTIGRAIGWDGATACEYYAREVRRERDRLRDLVRRLADSVSRLHLDPDDEDRRNAVALLAEADEELKR